MSNTSISFEDKELQHQFREIVVKITSSKDELHAEVRPTKRARASVELAKVAVHEMHETFDSKISKVLKISESQEGDISVALT